MATSTSSTSIGCPKRSLVWKYFTELNYYSLKGYCHRIRRSYAASVHGIVVNNHVGVAF